MILKKKLGGFIKLESNWTALVVFIVLTLFFFHHILTNLDYEADYDWKQVQFYHESARKSIVEYGQLPLWNPYECGGNVLLANPQQRVLSPMFIFTILFGTIIGLKIEVVLHLILGCLGMFVLAKHFKLKGVFAYIPPIVFMFSALFIRNLQAGSYDILPMAYMPFVIYYFLRGLEQSKYIFISCIFLVFTWFEGGIYVFIGLIIFLAIYTLFIYIEKKDPRCFLAYVKLMVVTFIFGAIKFIPNLFLFFHTKRVFQLKTGIGILDLLQTMIFPTVSHLDMNQTEYVLYVGIIITLLFLLGAVLCWKKNKTLILTTGVMTLIIMGFESSIPIWP